MKIFALADLHLSFGTPDKKMDIFGPEWVNHAERIGQHWRELVRDEDLVLLPGDISWGKRLEEALPDLEWIDRLPGEKVMIRGNHDYWWPSLAKLEALPFKSLHYIHNNAVRIGDVAVGGTRLWDNNAIDFSDYFPVTESAKPQENEKIYQRELYRLEESLKKMAQDAKVRIAMVHYPPIGPEGRPTAASELMEKYRVQICLFGHLHGVSKPIEYGTFGTIAYHLTSCDFLKCSPKCIVEI